MNPSNRFPHDLTISLIVKNEIATLEDCLKALTPLREQLSCQLIVTDTGSTDGTVEIAKQYADLFLEFDWCDDFSKARNHAIPHATGRWFFYIDADEICDDTLLELVSFLHSPESHTLGAVTVMQRNYFSPPSPSFSDLQTPRLLNFGKGRRFFEGRIHESVAIHKGSGCLPVILHHSGYLKENLSKKQNRNTPLLLQEVESNPQDLRTYVHLIQDLSSPEEKTTWIKRALEMTQAHPQSKQQFFYPALLIEWARLALHTSHISSLTQAHQLLLCDPALHCFKTLPHLELLGIELDFCVQHPSTPSAPHHLALDTLLSGYLGLFDALNHTPDRHYHGILAYRYQEPYHHARLTILALEQLERQGANGQLFSTLTDYKGYQWQNQQNIYPFLAKTTFLAMALDHYPKLQELLEFLQEKGPEKDLRDFSKILQDYLQKKGASQ